MLHALFQHIAGRNEAYVQQMHDMLAKVRADVLIVNEFAFTPGQIIAEKFRLPMFVFRYTPMLIPTTTRLNPLFGEGSRGAFLNWLSYVPAHLIRAHADRQSWRKIRKEQGLPSRSAIRQGLGVHARQFPTILGYSAQLASLPEDAPPWYFHTGPILPPAQETTEAIPPSLEAFLKETPADQPIVYIGFGSFSLTQFLPRPQAEQAARAMLQAIDELGVRAILLEHTFDFMIDDPVFKNPRWYIGQHFPHSWLFPRVSVIVHQGGAGHCAASARSGKPTVIVPIFEEQNMNGRALVAAGIGTILAVAELNCDNFKAALAAASKCADRARIVGDRIESEVQASGDRAVQGILRWLR